MGKCTLVNKKKTKLLMKTLFLGRTQLINYMPLIKLTKHDVHQTEHCLKVTCSYSSYMY